MRRNVILATILIMVMLLAGCGDLSDVRVVMSVGMSKDEVFRVDDMTCSRTEMLVYISNIAGEYVDVYGRDIFEASVEGETLGENVKQQALAKVSQVKVINLLALDRGVEPTEELLSVINEATDEYLESISEEELSRYQIDRDKIYDMYYEYGMSKLMYSTIIKDINPEISDDEARTITVEHILLKTFDIDENGNRVELDSFTKEEKKRLAEELVQRIEGGENFETLAAEYSEDANLTYAFGKGEMDAVFENAAFNLSGGEVSGVVETEFGYHIIKCISTFNREITDENKVKILKNRRDQAFRDIYDDFEENVSRELNDKIFDSLPDMKDERIGSKNFFDVFEDRWNESELVNL
ncbi:peptidylprolyl isomerase [Lacrimispora saccharolytica]|uniref:peptidylprolyl isomerase n=1 Tax=Lacrimispora saccharolytica TaxID=84030 RepID=UPI00265D17EE|nr:peptidylprolyl isomerase [Lacrimispora saccharolytica]MCF2656700.1 peptidylprolyl isomerase [Lacrimispora saccharolytica]